MIKRENLFYLLLLGTIVFLRVSVLIFPEKNFELFGLIIHHFWFGVPLIVASLFFRRGNVKTCIFAIGLGYIIDQIVFMILGAGFDKEYWALPSLLGTIVLVLLIFPFRKKIADKL